MSLRAPAAAIPAVLLALVLGCRDARATGGTAKAPEKTTPAADERGAPAEVLALVLDPAGEVTVTPPGGSHRLSVGTLQAVGDGASFELGPGATVELLCSNGGVVRLVASGPLTTERCVAARGRDPERFAALVPDGGKLRAWNGSLVLEGETREPRADDGLRPVLLAPRCPMEVSHALGCTALLDPEPTLRWTAVDAARHYEIHLDSDVVRIDADEVDCAAGGTLDRPVCELAWPADLELRAGHKSFLRVVAQTGLFERDKLSTEKSKLRLLDEAEAAVVRASAETVRALGLGASATDLLLVSLHVEARLYGEAIGLLESLAARRRDPLVDVALGDAYLRVDLLRPARRRYESALEALGAAPSAVRAAAELGLGQVHERSDAPEQARGHLERARELYLALGLDTAAADAARLLGALDAEAP